MSSQTDIDFFEFNKMRRNHDVIVIHKRLTTNKLREYIDRIEYQITKNKPLTLKSVLNFIPDLYNDKLEHDTRAEVESSNKMFFDEFLFKYMREKFKLKKIIKKNTEEFIMGIMKYAREDSRIDLLRRFLGIGDDKIRREVLDVYLALLKNIPVSYFKLFDEDYNTYLMNIELCFEIYHTRYPHFNLTQDNKTSILKHSQVVDSQTSLTKIIRDDKKLDYFLLNRFYNKSYILIGDLLNEYKNKRVIKKDITKIVEQFQNVNKEFKCSYEAVYEILTRNFNVEDEDIDLDTFFDFFAKNKYGFKIRVFDFLEISLNNLVLVFSLLEKKIGRMYDDVDSKKIGLIGNKEFEELLSKILVGIETKWKISDYFK